MSAQRSEHLVGLLGELPRCQGIPIEEKPKYRSGTAGILDDLAVLLVSQDEETVAVGIQPGPSKTTVTIAASGSSAPEAKSDHLYGVLTQMQEIGSQWREHVKDLKRRHKTDGISAFVEPSRSNSLPAKLQRDVDSFKRCILRFCVQKIWQLLENDYTVRFNKHISRLRSKSDVVIECFNGIAEALQLCHSILEQHKGDLAEIPACSFDMVEAAMWLLDLRVKCIFAVRDWNGTLRRELRGEALYFPYEWFLRKISAVTKVTDHLVSFALSKVHYYGFLDPARFKFVVQSLPNAIERQPVTLPDAPKLKHISHRILEKFGKPHLLEKPEALNVVPWETLTEKHEGRNVAASVHVECRLALYLVRQRRTSRPAVSYIGVSEPSCIACYRLLSTLLLQGILFETRGSHGHACSTWRFPERELAKTGLSTDVQDNLSKVFLGLLESLYASRFEDSAKGQLLSESVASAEYSDKEDKELIQPLARLREEHRKPTWRIFPDMLRYWVREHHLSRPCHRIAAVRCSTGRDD